MVTVQTRMDGGRVIVALCGELDLTGATEAAAVVAASAVPGRRVIVDLTGLDYIDCAALGPLADVGDLARRGGGDVLLAAPRSGVAAADPGRT